LENKESIYGFIIRDEGNYPFVFNKTSLIVLPRGLDDWEKKKEEVFLRINEMMNSSPNNNAWIRNEIIKGLTHNEKSIIFETRGNASLHNGIEIYEVKMFYEFKNNIQNEKNIDEIIIKSKDIDIFYNPADLFKKQIELDEQNKTKEVVVNVDHNENRPIEVGSYLFRNQRIKLFLSFGYNLKIHSEIPLKSYSQINIEFEESQKIDFVLEVIAHIRQMLQYLHNRKNIYIEEIVTIKKEKDHPPYTGNIFIVQNNTVEESIKKNDQCIKYQSIGNNIIEILNAISSGELYIAHLPKNIHNKNSIDLNRIILTFAAFEREYKIFYSQEKIRSERFEIKRKEIIAILEKNIKECKSKEKGYVREFIKSIESSGVNLGELIRRAIDDSYNIIEVFIIFLFSECNKDKIHEITQRLNNFRNFIAHGKLEFKIEPINVRDFQLLEILIYVMRLKRLDMDNQIIKRSLSKMFGYNIAI